LLVFPKSLEQAAVHMEHQLIMSPSRIVYLAMAAALTFQPALANTRQPDPGFLNDTLCTFEVLGLIPKSNLLNNTLLRWPKGSCCTTTDCELQQLNCPVNSQYTGSGGDICCYKADGNGAAAGMCKCGINRQPQGTCF
jgi:hypothetical protein